MDKTSLIVCYVALECIVPVVDWKTHPACVVLDIIVCKEQRVEHLSITTILLSLNAYVQLMQQVSKTLFIQLDNQNDLKKYSIPEMNMPSN